MEIPRSLLQEAQKSVRKAWMTFMGYDRIDGTRGNGDSYDMAFALAAGAHCEKRLVGSTYEFRRAVTAQIQDLVRGGGEMSDAKDNEYVHGGISFGSDAPQPHGVKFNQKSRPEQLPGPPKQETSMKTIWKFPLAADGLVRMPIGAEILSVQVQDGQPVIWALVDSDAETETRMFRVVATGQHFAPRPEDRYVGTMQLGQLVFHIFDGGSAPWEVLL